MLTEEQESWLRLLGWASIARRVCDNCRGVAEVVWRGRGVASTYTMQLCETCLFKGRSS